MHPRLGELLELTRVRVLVFWREPEAVFWVFAFPVILAMVLGLAFRETGVGDEPVAVVKGAESEDIVAALEAAEHIEVKLAESAVEADEWLRSGKVAALVSPGNGDGDGGVVMRYDPSRPQGDLARLRIESAIQVHGGRTDPVTIARDEVEETGSRYIDWLIPGLIGMNLMGTGIWGIGFAIVDARQKKLLKRFLVTPMSRASYLFAFILSRLIFLVLEVVLLMLFATYALGVPVKGSLFAIGFLCLLGALSFTGLGLLIASRARTIEGVSGIMNFTMMPMWLCSGVFFSYERFPEVAHPFMEAIPLTALNNALRDVYLEGAGILDVLPEIGIQAAWGIATFILALKVFRWK